MKKIFRILLSIILSFSMILNSFAGIEFAELIDMPVTPNPTWTRDWNHFNIGGLNVQFVTQTEDGVAKVEKEIHCLPASLKSTEGNKFTEDITSSGPTIECYNLFSGSITHSGTQYPIYQTNWSDGTQHRVDIEEVRISLGSIPLTNTYFLSVLPVFDIGGRIPIVTLGSPDKHGYFDGEVSVSSSSSNYLPTIIKEQNVEWITNFLNELDGQGVSIDSYPSLLSWLTAYDGTKGNTNGIVFRQEDYYINYGSGPVTEPTKENLEKYFEHYISSDGDLDYYKLKNNSVKDIAGYNYPTYHKDLNTLTSSYQPENIAKVIDAYNLGGVKVGKVNRIFGDSRYFYANTGIIFGYKIREIIDGTGGGGGGTGSECKCDGKITEPPAGEFEYNYDNTRCQEAYLELKNGSKEGYERFEAMAGMPSKEKLHLDLGARSMYTKYTGIVRPVDQMVNKEIGNGKVIVHVPWYTTEEPCIANISYSGQGGVSGLTLADGEHSTLTNWVNQQTSKCNAFVPTVTTTCTTTEYGGNPPTVTHSPAGSVSGGSITGTTTIRIPGCCFKDGVDQTITLPASWKAPGHCHGDNYSPAESGTWPLSFTTTHKENGYMGGGVTPLQYAPLYNFEGAVVNNRNADTNFGCQASHLQDERFNHIWVADLAINIKYNINTAGRLWTALLKNKPQVALLNETKILKGPDGANYNVTSANVATTEEFVAAHFKDDTYRFSSDVNPTYINGPTDSGLTTSGEEFWRGLLTPADDVYLDIGYTLPMEFTEHTREKSRNIRTMSCMDWSDISNKMKVEPNKRLNNFYLNTNLATQQELVNNCIKDIYRIVDTGNYYNQGQDNSFHHGLFYSTDILETRMNSFMTSFKDVSALHGGYVLAPSSDNIFNLDTYTPITWAAGSLVKGQLPITVKCDTNTLKSICNAEEWTTEKAYERLVKKGKKKFFFSLVGYNGNYHIYEEDDPDELEYTKLAGIGIAAAGESACFTTDGVWHNAVSTYNQTGVVWPKYMHKFKSNSQIDSATKWNGWIKDKLDVSNTVTIRDPETENGIYHPIDKATLTYTNPDEGYAQNLSGVTTINSKYINTNFDDTIDHDGLGCNRIVIHNPVTTQYCQVICNPDYMDQRIRDDEVYRGGDSTTTNYQVERQMLTSTAKRISSDGMSTVQNEYTLHNIAYVNGDSNNDYRIYLDTTTPEFNSNPETTDEAAYNEVTDRRKTNNFVNLGKEFEMVFSDMFSIYHDEFGNTLDDEEDDYLDEDRRFILDKNGNKIYSEDLFGLNTCSDILGYGWGDENFEGKGQYASACPISNKYGDGVHNYVKSRYVFAPFDMTVITSDRKYKTFKRGQVFDMNDLWQWKSDNEKQQYVDLANVTLNETDSITGTQQKFKFKGSTHPGMHDDGTATDNSISSGKHLDRLVYGLCLLSNNENANAPNQFLAIGNNCYGGDVEVYGDLESSDINTADFDNRFVDVSYESKGVAKCYKYVDIVGLIGNLCLNDTGDFRFANIFKESAGDGTWYVEGLVPQVDPSRTKTVFQLPFNIIDDSNDIWPAGNTTGTQAHKEHYVPLPLTAYQNNIDALKQDQLRAGYAQYFDIETYGNYNGLNSQYDNLTNRLSIKTKYYYYDYDTHELDKLNVYYLDDGNYKCANRFEYGFTEDNFGVTLQQDAVELQNRANVTAEEQNRNAAVMASGKAKTSMITTTREDTVGTTNLLIYDMNNRDYIGSEYLRGRDSLGENRLDILKDGFSGDGDEYIGLGDFYLHNQKYYTTIQLPTSAVFIRCEDDIAGADYNALSQEIKNDNGCILEVAQIQAYGEFWSLQFKSRTAALNQRVHLTEDKDLMINLDELDGELIAVLDNRYNASDDYSTRGLY